MENDKKLNPVVSSPAKRQKKTGIQKIAQTVSSNLEKNDVKGKIVNDIILPMVLDMVNIGLAGMFGIDPGRSRKTLDGVVSTVRSSSYWGASNKKEYVETTGRVTRSVYDFDNPIYSTLGDAEEVVRSLQACLEKYQRISVSDILQLSNIIPSSVDYKYGWTSLNGVDIVHVAEGYMLRMTKPVPLD
jgi:hypothetical protein